MVHSQTSASNVGAEDMQFYTRHRMIPERIDLHSNILASRYFFTTFTKSEYIHPLSQIVLEHLQSHHSQWIQQVGLDTGLRLNKDGTFVLRFPGSGDEAVDETAVDGSIW